MFQYCTDLENIKVNFNTINVVDMSSMFEDCQSLTSLDISSFDTSNVKEAPSLFQDCSSLVSLRYDKMNVENMVDISRMFQGCENLKSLPEIGRFQLFIP